jgi:hypothetical protein
MSPAYKRMRRVARRVGRLYGREPYSLVLSFFAARLRELYDDGELQPEERDGLWRTAYPGASWPVPRVAHA